HMYLLLCVFFRYTLVRRCCMTEHAIDWQLLGERVHMARRRRGLTSGELARLAGTTRVTISRLENRKKPGVSFAVLWRIAQVLQVSLDWLTGQQEQQEESDVDEEPEQEEESFSRKPAPVG